MRQDLESWRVIEARRSRHLETGLETGVCNWRGVTVRQRDEVIDHRASATFCLSS